MFQGTVIGADPGRALRSAESLGAPLTVGKSLSIDIYQEDFLIFKIVVDSFVRTSTGSDGDAQLVFFAA